MTATKARFFINAATKDVYENIFYTTVILRCCNKNGILCALFCLLCLVSVSCKKTLPKQTITIEKANGDKVTIIAEVAKTFDERQKGFMGRRNIPRGTGMLFVFDRDEILNFWMKDTPVALSIAYITRAGIICDILDMTPFSLTSVTSTHYARYALEVPKGWFAENDVVVGDRVDILDK